jgi:hypothetical protein
MITYTLSEKTKKSHAIGKAIQTACEIVKGPICLDAVGRRNPDTLLTLPEYNELVDQIISDSTFYG